LTTHLRLVNRLSISGATPLRPPMSSRSGQETFYLSTSVWLRITSGMRRRVADRVVPDVSKERDSSEFIWIPRSWKMKVLFVFEKTQAAAPNSTQLHILHQLKSPFINCLYVIKTCCVLTRRNGNRVWFCIYFKTKLSAVIKVLFCRLAPSYGLYSLPNIVRVIKSRRLRWTEHVARMG
jgi:hypothetical protein